MSARTRIVSIGLRAPLLAALFAPTSAPHAQGAAADWPVYGGNSDNTHYSTLGQITPANVRQLHGDPRGRWEGDTLVVETTNYSDGSMMMGATRDMRITERYTRVSAGYINQLITVDDPKTWTAPWTFMVRLKRTDDLVYEYACHEGNYSMSGILAGARLEEKKAAAKA